MSEALDVLRAITDLSERGEDLALATIVSTSGSTYRAAGARLVVPAVGSSVGNISGGCLEGYVEEIARDVIASGATRLVEFDLTADDEAVWGWGLGCNGRIEVLIEPADRAAEIAEMLGAAIVDERRLAVVTVLSDDVDGIEQGARLVLHADGTTHGSLGDAPADEAAVEAAREVLAKGASSTTELHLSEARLRVFIEAILPPPRLLVCGAGHDARPVVEFAARLGWRVVVVDDRATFLAEDRFPAAAGFVHVGKPDEAAEAAGTDDRTYVVIMSHNYLRDAGYLRAFLRSEVAYVGALGPRRRLERLLDDLAGQGVHPADDTLLRVHGPAGLDIGADGPDEIAVAIVAEILAVHRDRVGGFLRDRSGPIHLPDAPEAMLAADSDA